MASRARINPATIVLIVIGVILVIVGIMYLTIPANNLPGFFPGATDPVLPKCGGDLQPPLECFRERTYGKRGIAVLLLSVACFVGAWYTSGMRARRDVV